MNATLEQKQNETRAPLRERILRELAIHQNRHSGALVTDQDLALADLTQSVGFVAGTVIWNNSPATQEKFPLKSHLQQIAAFAIGWAESFGGLPVFSLVEAERERQHRMFLAGKHSFNCCFPHIEPKRKARILVEEIGEVANAIDEVECDRMNECHIKEELVHVAAVAVAWLESLEAA